MTRDDLIEALAIEAMSSVRVTIFREDGKFPGNLTDVSCKMLLVELERSGFTIERR